MATTQLFLAICFIFVAFMEPSHTYLSRPGKRGIFQVTVERSKTEMTKELEAVSMRWGSLLLLYQALKKQKIAEGKSISKYLKMKNGNMDIPLPLTGKKIESEIIPRLFNATQNSRDWILELH